MTARQVENAMRRALDGHFYVMRMANGGVCEVVDTGGARFSADRLHRDAAEAPDTGSNRIHHGTVDLTPAHLRRAAHYLAAGLSLAEIAASMGVGELKLARGLNRRTGA